MTDIANRPPVTERELTMGRARDWPALAGIAFAPLFFLGFAVEVEEPDYDAPLEEWVNWATDSGNGLSSLISIYFFVLAALALVVFVTGLARRIRTAHGEANPAGGYVYGLGLLAAALLVAGAVIVNTGPIVYIFDGGDIGTIADPTDSQFFIQISSVGYLIVWVGMALAVAALIAITSASLRDSMPSWFTIFGYVAAAILLASVMFIPLVLVPIWTLTAGIVLLRRPVAA